MKDTYYRVYKNGGINTSIESKSRITKKREKKDIGPFKIFQM